MSACLEPSVSSQRHHPPRLAPVAKAVATETEWKLEQDPIEDEHAKVHQYPRLLDTRAFARRTSSCESFKTQCFLATSRECASTARCQRERVHGAKHCITSIVQGDHPLWPVAVTETGLVREEHSVVCSVAPLPLEVRRLQQRPLHASTRDAAQKDHLCEVVVVRWLSDLPFEMLGNTLQRRGLLQKGTLTKPAPQRRRQSSFCAEDVENSVAVIAPDYACTPVLQRDLH